MSDWTRDNCTVETINRIWHAEDEMTLLFIHALDAINKHFKTDFSFVECSDWEEADWFSYDYFAIKFKYKVPRLNKMHEIYFDSRILDTSWDADTDCGAYKAKLLKDKIVIRIAWAFWKWEKKLIKDLYNK